MKIFFGIIVFAGLLVGRGYTQNVIIELDGPDLSPGYLTKEIKGQQSLPVLSEKKIKEKYDSLEGLVPGIRKYARGHVQQKVSEEELIGLLNKKFFVDSRKANHTNPENLLGSGLENPLDRQAKINSVDGLKDLPNKDINLSGYKLDIPDAKKSIPPLSRNIVRSEHLFFLDSIRDYNLKVGRYTMKEVNISKTERLSIIKRKPTIHERSYFEALLGLYAGSFESFNFSPAYAFTFTENFSLGVGPRFSISTNNRSFIDNLGLRYFSKVEFLKRKAYLQLEDNIRLHREASEMGEKRMFHNHEVLAGAGYVVSIGSPLSLNFALMYRLRYHNEEFVTSPWVLRIGISTIKSIRR